MWDDILINEELKTDLITAILSSPIIYIPHFHYHYIDSVLNDLVCSEDNVLGLSKEDISEFDTVRTILDFQDKTVKMKSSATLSDYLVNLVNRDKDSDGYKILVLKNINKTLFETEADKFQLLLQMFAERYERKEYDARTTIIMISPLSVSCLPREIINIINVIEIKQPTEEDIRKCINKIQVSKRWHIWEESLRNDLCRTLQGLQWYDIHQILRSTLIRTGNVLTNSTINLALQEKKKIVKKSGIIEVVDSNESFKDIGGLEILQKDISRKAKIFKNLSLINSKKINLPIPKGILIIGMPGCGKSMIAKSISNEFGVSLLRLDISSLMGKYVGESEENLRNALKTAEAAHPCVLWIDEIAKAFHGANSTNNSENDGLVMRMMGYFLTWMQERKSAVYIVATANDTMRPEFMRKGRFDEVYFVDFPNDNEREIILKKKIENYDKTKNNVSVFDFSKIKDFKNIVQKMKGKYGGFSGAEIKCVVDTVIEKRVVESLEIIEKEKGEDSISIEDVKTISITEKDFTDVIEEMEDSVLCNQVGTNGEKTAIENIREMNKIYKFKPASK